MEVIATTPGIWEYSTAPEYNSGDHIKKNQKIGGCFQVIFEKKKDTTPEGGRSWESVISLFEIAHDLSDKYKNLILAYKRENEINSQGVLNEIYLKEYKPKSSIRTFNSLTEMGEEMFKDARPINKEEAEVLSVFVRSKSMIISSKKL